MKKYIYVDTYSKPKRIIVEENNTYIVYTKLEIKGPSEMICGKKFGFHHTEVSVWIETFAEVSGLLAEIQEIPKATVK